MCENRAESWLAKMSGFCLGRLHQPAEQARGRSGVLGEQEEEQPVEEARHLVRVLPAAAKRLGQLGEPAGGRGRQLLRGAPGLELLGVVVIARRIRSGSSGAIAMSSRSNR